MLHHQRQPLTNQLTQLLCREIEEPIVEALLGHRMPFANHPRRPRLHVSCDILELRIADRVVLERARCWSWPSTWIWKWVWLQIGIVVETLRAEPCEQRSRIVSWRLGCGGGGRFGGGEAVFLVRQRLGAGHGGDVVGGELALDLGVADEEGGPGVVEGLGEVREEGGGWEEGGGFEAGGTGLGWWGHALC